MTNSGGLILKWISYDEVRPRSGQMVLIVTDQGVGCAKYDAFNDTLDHVMIPGNTQFSSYEVTYWMPLPEPPSY